MMLHTVIPLSVVFPDGDYPSEYGSPEPKQCGHGVESTDLRPISTDLRDHLPNRGD